MKSFLRKIVLLTLKFLAKRRLKKFRGRIVAVTGSVGKTSTKDAIFAVLNSRFRVKKSDKSMNSEFGLLLTILDIESGFSSLPKWSWFLIKAFWHSFFRDHSEILLLEMGVDRPGDMDFLTSVVRPDIAVLTNISPVHLDEGQFSDLQSIFDEKKKLVEALKPGGRAVLNIDDHFLADFAKKLGKKQNFTYGVSENADYRIGAIKTSLEGVRYILNHDEQRFEVKNTVIGDFQSYVLTSSIIVGNLFGMTTEEAIISLNRYVLPPGRMNVIEGKNGMTVLDSTYNSSPQALKAALKLLKTLGLSRRKVAVLGNMNELGDQSDALHKMSGEFVPGSADVLVTVGKSAKLIAEGAIERGMKEENVFIFNSTAEAIKSTEDFLEEGDLVLVKGSQNRIRLERFVKEIMAHPDAAKDLLVRQERSWANKL